jgi:HTH-type transcriptional regulator/antitoxin HipB
MQIRTAADLKATIRDHRVKLGMDQRSLAEKVGVGRQWIVEVEKGKPRAQIGLLLRTINVLGVSLAVETLTTRKPKKDTGLPPVNLDAIVSAARTKKP